MTVTSGPGLALKTEFIGLAVMTELPLIVIDVQRGGPSTGLPTKVEQSDLLSVIYGQPGDAPKVVIAPSTIPQCFEIMIDARRIAEEYRTPVFIMSDANLATGVTPFERPKLDLATVAPMPDQTPAPDDALAYDWDPETGKSPRYIPGQRGGEHTVTGLNHDKNSVVVYDPTTNQHSHAMRSKKIETFGKTLAPVKLYGADQGDLLLIGWGSTRGAIEEAVDRARAEGLAVSAMHLTYLSPLEPGIKEACDRFRRVISIELNYADYSDDLDNAPPTRRLGQMAILLRSQLLVNVESWGNVPGAPLRPNFLLNDIIKRYIPKD
jgi:2-oxoglutarate ferredoxin oxidoreductase subunit alpha